jgi:NAD-dependent deacetylase
MTPVDDRALDALADRLAAARAVTVLTGAGVSVASGVPTFRGPDGLWQRHRPEDLATAGAFARNPRLVWEWYDWRRQLLARCVPNRAHEVLASWSGRWPRFTVVTQNVDGLHERAGLGTVVRLHGSIWEVSCWSGCDSSPARWRDETVPYRSLPPCCPWCGGLVRPAVVWFGEPLASEPWALAEAAAACDVFVSAGTSAVVFPAAGLIDLAARHGACTVEINPEPTDASATVDLVVPLPAETAFDLVDRRLAPRAP